ncbi:MAG: dicarboxylate/amino acid:cation symporter [Cytophagales bacterium]
MKNSILGIESRLFLVLAFILFSIQFFADPQLAMIMRWSSIFLGLIFVFEKAKLTYWIFWSMFLGLCVGHDIPTLGAEANLVSKIFIRLIKCIVAPLIFATLVTGIAGHSDIKKLGSMGWKSILYFETVTTIAIIIGLLAINFSGAGFGLEMPAGSDLDSLKIVPKTWQETILHVFPENIAKSIVEGEMLQVVVFSLIFGFAMAVLPNKEKQAMLEFTESLTHIMFKFTNIVMYLAPLAVGAAMAYTVSHMGLSVLWNLFKLLATLYLSLLAFVFLVLLPIAMYNKVNIKSFIKVITEPVTIAFATTSSESALPKAMENLVKFGVPKKIVGFVMPLGYSFNLDGTSLYLSLASIFVAQVAGIELTWQQQLQIALTLMLTSKGIAGVPRASMVILLGTAASFGLPVEPIFIILGIDELMDMARTSVNVIGNCLATVVVAKWEGEWEEHVVYAEQPIDQSQIEQ